MNNIIMVRYNGRAVVMTMHMLWISLMLLVWMRLMVLMLLIMILMAKPMQSQHWCLEKITLPKMFPKLQ